MVPSPAVQPSYTTEDEPPVSARAARGMNDTLVANEDDSILALPGYACYRPNEDFRATKRVAEGGMGEVWLGEILDPGLLKKNSGEKRIVIKITTKSLGEVAFTQEVSIMNYLNGCRNIATFLGYNMNQPMAILMKLYPMGALDSFLDRKYPGIRRRTVFVFNVLHGVACGLLSMHAKGIAHCDIKPGNILLEPLEAKIPDVLRPVITDFGISRIMKQDILAVKAFHAVEQNAASFRYAAPEVLKAFRSRRPLHGQDPSRTLAAIDVFSYSMLMLEVITGELPWYLDPNAPPPSFRRK